MKKIFLCLFFFHQYLFHAQTYIIRDENDIIKGNEQLDVYLPLIKDKRVALVANASSTIHHKHLLDTLLSCQINIKKIFCPEHGFRGNIDAGEKVNDSIDIKTGIPIISLYGRHKQPTQKDFEDIDIVVFDLQDVGVRFYTYISTLYYVIKSCALYNKPLIVLDRPNPNGFYIDGPVLDTNYRSFVGIIPIPIVYGMTIGELSLMMNQEKKFMPTNKSIELKVVPLKNYHHNILVKMHTIPSPNLNTWQSIILYPSLGLFEGTVVSVGRGTPHPFTILVHPKYPNKTFCITPEPNFVSKDPKYKNTLCCGMNLIDDDYLQHHPKKINLYWLLQFYRKIKTKNFFDKNFDYHVGNSQLRKDIQNNISEEKIRERWNKDIDVFKKIRKKYLLYDEE